MGSGNKFINNYFISSKFVASFQSYNELPVSDDIKEFCFIGRSNVGKSSIINAITKNKKLAKTSKTPGRTQSINLFQIKNKINIIDLPGYGFAKVSKVMRTNLMLLIEDYMKYRANLNHIFVLVDAKVGLKSSDIDMFDFLSNLDKSFSIVLTKIDKCSKSHLVLEKKSIINLMKTYSTFFCKIFVTASKK